MERSPRKIAIVAAMEEELAPFKDYYQPNFFYQKGKCVIWNTTLGDTAIFLVESGIGKVNAAFSATLLCEKIAPDLIINTGSAGGFPNRVTIGDVVVANEVTYGDVDATAFNYVDGQVPQMPACYSLDNSFDFLFDEQSLEYTVHHGLILTSDSFMSESKRVNDIQKRFKKALASDMEGAAIAQVAAFFNIPLLNIRGISDIAGQNAAETFDNQLSQAAQNAFTIVQAVCFSIN